MSKNFFLYLRSTFGLLVLAGLIACAGTSGVGGGDVPVGGGLDDLASFNNQAANDPLSAGAPDLYEDVDILIVALSLRIELNCSDLFVPRIGFHFITKLAFKKPSHRYVRFVAFKENKYIDTETDSDGNIEADIVINYEMNPGFTLPLRAYVMKKDFVPGELYKELPCGNGLCGPNNKKEIGVYPPLGFLPPALIPIPGHYENRYPTCNSHDDEEKVELENKNGTAINRTLSNQPNVTIQHDPSAIEEELPSP